MAIRDQVAGGGPSSYGGIGDRREILRPFRGRLAAAWTLRLGRELLGTALDAAYGPSADLERAMAGCRIPADAFFVEVDPVELRDAAVERGSPAKVRGGSVPYEGIGMLISPGEGSVTVETVTSTRFKGLVLADLCPVVAACAIGSPRDDEPTGPARAPDMKGATGALAEHVLAHRHGSAGTDRRGPPGGAHRVHAAPRPRRDRRPSRRRPRRPRTHLGHGRGPEGGDPRAHPHRAHAGPRRHGFRHDPERAAMTRIWPEAAILLAALVPGPARAGDASIVPVLGCRIEPLLRGALRVEASPGVPARARLARAGGLPSASMERVDGSTLLRDADGEPAAWLHPGGWVGTADVGCRGGARISPPGPGGRRTLTRDGHAVATVEGMGREWVEGR